MRRKKVAIVTGCSAGIGRAICEVLLENNYHVAAIDTHEPPPALADGPLLFQQGDASDEEQAQDICDRAKKRWGHIDALVNNVGIFTQKPIAELSYSEWKRVIDINLGSAFLFAKICAPSLRENKGAIVSIASTRATQSEANTESYSASKGGIVALTHSLAISLGPEVRANCISPGWIDTRAPSEKNKKALRAADHAQHPVGRVGEPDDVARLTLFLLSEEASFISGQEFVIDGGMTKKMIYAE